MKVDVREGSIKALATEALVDMAEASQDSIAAYWSDMMSQTLYEIKQDLHFVVVDESVSISRKIAYDSYKQWCASNNEIVYKNRKFQSDTATIANIECYRNSTDRYWLIHVSE
jgi:phage/plasmid-associated DNA primase